MDGGREDGAVAGVDKDRAARLRPEVDTDGVPAQHLSPVFETGQVYVARRVGRGISHQTAGPCEALAFPLTFTVER